MTSAPLQVTTVVQKSAPERLARGLLYVAGAVFLYILFVSVVVRFPVFYQVLSSQEFKVVLVLAALWAIGTIVYKSLKKMPVRIEGQVDTLSESGRLAWKILAINSGLLMIGLFWMYILVPMTNKAVGPNGFLHIGFILVHGLLGVYGLVGSIAIIVLAGVGIAKSFSRGKSGLWEIQVASLLANAAIPVLAWCTRFLFYLVRDL